MSNSIIEKREVRELIKSNLLDFFKNIGFLYKPNMNGMPGFFRGTSYGFDRIGFSIVSTGVTDLMKMNIRHDQVEKIILEIGLPNRGPITKYEYTCYDSFSQFMPNEKREYFFSEEDINKYCGEVRNYIVEVGLPFAEKFSNLDKILERINELESRQETCLDFLGHGPDHLYRVAIISKLCDDPLYVQKVEKITARLVSIQGLHPWIPGFEKLKTILETGD